MILVQTLVGVTIVWLRMLVRPGFQFVFVDEHFAALDPGRESWQGFPVVVLADARIEAVVPTVHTANQVIAVDMAIRHECATVGAAAVEHTDRFVVAYDPQTKLEDILCNKFNQNESKIDLNQCVPQRLLPMTIAAFKTPLLRDLGHSNPYMHTGQFNTVEEAVLFYITSSALARQQQLRNVDRDLQHINLSVNNIDILVSFLKALNEDYD